MNVWITHIFASLKRVQFADLFLSHSSHFKAEFNLQDCTSRSSLMLSRLTRSNRSDQKSKSLRNQAATLIAFVAWSGALDTISNFVEWYSPKARSGLSLALYRCTSLQTFGTASRFGLRYVLLWL